VVNLAAIFFKAAIFLKREKVISSAEKDNLIDIA